MSLCATHTIKNLHTNCNRLVSLKVHLAIVRLDIVTVYVSTLAVGGHHIHTVNPFTCVAVHLDKKNYLYCLK